MPWLLTAPKDLKILAQAWVYVAVVCTGVQFTDAAK